MVVVFDENGAARHGASFGAKFSGAENHGDALDIMYESSKADYFIYNTGHIDSLNGNFYGFNVVGCDTTETQSAYLAMLRYDLNTSNIISDSIRIYDGPVSTGKDVIVTELGDTGPRYPHQVIFCGEFLDTINAGGVCDSTWEIASAGGQDGFIGCTDYTLNTMWFYNEGVNLGNFETVEALDFKGTNKVYATGSFMDAPTTHFLSADNPGESYSGVDAGGVSDVGVFVCHFKLNGDSVSAFEADGAGGDINSGTDLFVANNTVFLSGILRSTGLDFDHTTLSRSNLGEEGFIARFRVQTDTFYKRDREQLTKVFLDSELHIYPNPNNGKFEVKFNQESSGIVLIYSIIGETVYLERFVKKNELTFELNLTSGLYFLKLVCNETHEKIPFVITK